jgi:hypothetical protein
VARSEPTSSRRREILEFLSVAGVKQPRARWRAAAQREQDDADSERPAAVGEQRVACEAVAAENHDATKDERLEPGDRLLVGGGRREVAGCARGARDANLTQWQVGVDRLIR